MYSGVLDMTSAKSRELELLNAADKYGVEELKQYLELPLCALLSTVNAFELLRASERHDVPHLKEASVEHIIHKMDREESAIILKEMMFGDDMTERVLAGTIMERLWLSKP
ncbi:hypothetical protein CLOP_g10085 [Closterium sp. NIES-67]|nr:hypothetical protein CLOP_g10085 [Closterium sp. NIES-67]